VGVCEAVGVGDSVLVGVLVSGGLTVLVGVSEELAKDEHDARMKYKVREAANLMIFNSARSADSILGDPSIRKGIFSGPEN
jgi:hypothetical protein